MLATLPLCPLENLAVAEAGLSEVGGSVLGLVSDEVVAVIVDCSSLITNGAATVVTSSDTGKGVEAAGGGEDCISVAVSSLPLPIIMIK